MELIPEPFEYLFLLGVYLAILLALLWRQVPHLLRSRAFWFSGAFFMLCWTLIEIFGLWHGQWLYSETRLCGLALLTVPLEEYIVFALIHLATVGSWHLFATEEAGEASRAVEPGRGEPR